MTQEVRIERMPPDFDLEAVGEFIRVGPDTLVRWDQIGGVRGLTVRVGTITVPDEPEADEGADVEVDGKHARAVSADKIKERLTAFETAEAALPTIEGTQLYLVGNMPMPVEDSEGRPIRNLVVPKPVGDVLAIISAARRWSLRTTGRYASEGGED